MGKALRAQQSCHCWSKTEGEAEIGREGDREKDREQTIRYIGLPLEMFLWQMLAKQLQQSPVQWIEHEFVTIFKEIAEKWMQWNIISNIENKILKMQRNIKILTFYVKFDILNTLKAHPIPLEWSYRLRLSPRLRTVIPEQTLSFWTTTRFIFILCTRLPAPSESFTNYSTSPSHTLPLSVSCHTILKHNFNRFMQMALNVAELCLNLLYGVHAATNLALGQSLERQKGRERERETEEEV